MSAAPRLFRFAQFEYPWPLGPPDGRYLLRAPGRSATSDPTHVLVLATLSTRERRSAGRRSRKAQPEPEPSQVSIGRATVIDVGSALGDRAHARQWLARAGEPELGDALAVLNRALHAFRVVSADPYVHPVGRGQALVARLGFGPGEQVADGLWSDARELHQRGRRRSRTKVLEPQARLAAVLGGAQRVLVSEELALRARLDLEQGREREAALQVLVALDAALAEAQADPAAPVLASRLSELRGHREAIARAAQSALATPLARDERETVERALDLVQATLRARALASA